VVECAICAAHGIEDSQTPAATATEIPHVPARDGARLRIVHACPECAAQIPCCSRHGLPLIEGERTCQRCEDADDARIDRGERLSGQAQNDRGAWSRD